MPSLVHNDLPPVWAGRQVAQRVRATDERFCNLARRGVARARRGGGSRVAQRATVGRAQA